MNIRVLLVGLLFLITWCTFAAQLTLPSLTVGTRTYREVKVLGANATDLYFTHQDGIGNVKLKYLSPELQKRFNYDPDKAAAAEQQQLLDDLAYRSNLVVQATARAANKDGQTNKVTESLADPISDRSLLGKPAPALQVERWVPKEPAVDGKYVLVFFWVSDSPASQRALPALSALQKKFGQKLTVLALNAQPASVGDLPPQFKADFTLGIDPQARLSRAANVTSVPQVLLLDPNRTVLYQGHPAVFTDQAMANILGMVSTTAKAANGSETQTAAPTTE